MALCYTTRATNHICRRISNRTNQLRRVQSQAEVECSSDALQRLGEISVDCPHLIPRVVAQLSPQLREELGSIINKEIIAPDEVHVTKTQLVRLAVWYGTPMIGFGFCDNAIMIIAGDYIDTSLCFSLGYGTMFAAAVGNIISDVAGVALGGVIENLANKLGLKHHQISPHQLQSRKCLIVKYSGIALGIAFGCVIGMFPLLWPEKYRIWQTKEDRKKDEEKRRSEDSTLSSTQTQAGMI